MNLYFYKSGTGHVLSPDLRRGYKNLLVIDRSNGEVETISLDDANSTASVAHGAKMAELMVNTAWEILLDGGTISTTGYLRRLSKDHTSEAHKPGGIREHLHDMLG